MWAWTTGFKHQHNLLLSGLIMTGSSEQYEVDV